MSASGAAHLLTMAADTDHGRTEHGPGALVVRAFGGGREEPVAAVECRVDLVCVYGYAVADDGTIPPRLEVRLRAALELSRRHPGAMLLLSGGAVHSRHCEAVAMRNWLLAAGVDGGRMVLLMTAQDTVGNVREFVEHIDTIGRPVRVAAVSSIEHMPRAALSLCAALERRGYPAAVVGVAIDAAPDPEAVEWEDRHMVETIQRAAALYEPAAAAA